MACALSDAPWHFANGDSFCSLCRLSTYVSLCCTTVLCSVLLSAQIESHHQRGWRITNLAGERARSVEYYANCRSLWKRVATQEGERASATQYISIQLLSVVLLSLILLPFRNTASDTELGVVMSEGVHGTLPEQRWYSSASFPLRWIEEQWRENRCVEEKTKRSGNSFLLYSLQQLLYFLSYKLLSIFMHYVVLSHHSLTLTRTLTCIHPPTHTLSLTRSLNLSLPLISLSFSFSLLLLQTRQWVLTDLASTSEGWVVVMSKVRREELWITWVLPTPR